MYRKFIKRFLDIIFSLILLILLSPILLIIALIIYFKLGKPVLFKQPRPGHLDKIFTLYKFRTMKNSTDAQGQLLPDEMRLTKFGNFLRKSSLDELPELLNVLKGEMSFVGPRPLLVEYLNHYTQDQRQRHAILPGITGLAQIKGRNQLSWDEKFKLDIWYVNHYSFALDLKIILHTFYVTFKSKGISAEGHATMPKFHSENASHRESRD